MSGSPPEQLSLNDAIGVALRHHGAGDLGRAEQIYRQILATDPNQPDALHLLGVIAHQMDQNDAAIEMIGKALTIQPNNPQALSNLGNAQQALGKLEEAITSYERALTAQPEMAQVRVNLANARAKHGQVAQAVEDYKVALKQAPKLADAHRSLGVALQALGRKLEALECLLQAHELSSDSVETQIALGNVLQDLARPEDAVYWYRLVLAKLPDFASAHVNLGNALYSLGRLEEGLSHYNRALGLEPDNALAHYNKAVSLQGKGDMEGAAVHFRKAIELMPDYAEAHRMLAALVKHTEYDADMRSMEQAYETADLSTEKKMHYALGLGKSYADLGEYEKSFRYYLEGNTIRRTMFDFSLESDIELFENLKHTFTPEYFAANTGAGVEDETPIFIVGMPRSGTTLVEQILASHPEVHGGGELRTLHRCIALAFKLRDEVDYTESLAGAKAGVFSELASQYMESLRKLSPDARFVTDKMPMNFLNIGMIKMMLPKARVIHCRRSAEDTCLSNYKNFFPSNGHQHTYDLVELGRYYNMYLDLMAHWQAVLPEFIYNIQYEDLVADQEVQTRALLDACDLEWDPACLEFHKTKRSVSTISATQVRQPLYKSSVQLWRRYGEQLNPLLDVLHKNS